MAGKSENENELGQDDKTMSEMIGLTQSLIDASSQLLSHQGELTVSDEVTIISTMTFNVLSNTLDGMNKHEPLNLQVGTQPQIS